MKISGAIIANRFISKSTADEFIATYKGHGICITTNHGHGSPKFDHLKRFDIVVIHTKSGCRTVDTYKDFHNITDAIRYALDGSCLINLKQNEEN